MPRWCASTAARAHCELLLGRTYRAGPATARAPGRAGPGRRRAVARRARHARRADRPRRSPTPRCACSTKPASTPAQVRAIGSHGQTRAPSPRRRALRRRIRSPGSSATRNVIAERTRHRPRSPTSAAATSPPAARARRWCRPSTPRCCTTPDEDRAVLNLGGIANFTLLPRARRRARLRHRPGQRADGCLVPAPHAASAFDADGAFAAQRHASTRPARAPARRAVVRAAAAEEHRPRAVPPRLAAGAPGAAAKRAGRRAGDAAANSPRAPSPMRCARTSRDTRARAGLRRRRAQPGAAARASPRDLPGVRVESTAAHGLDPDFVEAMGFAWLARRNPGRAARQPAQRHRRARAARARRASTRA